MKNSNMKKSCTQGSPRGARGLRRTFSLIIIWSILICSVTPIIAKADHTLNVTYSSVGFSYSGMNFALQNTSYNLPVAYTNTNYKMSDIWHVVFRFDFNKCEIKKGNIVVLNIELWDNDRFKDFSNGGLYLYDAEGDVSGTLKSVSYSDNIITIKWKATQTFSEGKFDLDFNGFKVNSSYNNCYIRVDDISVDIEDENKGLLNSILEWLRTIKESIGNLPQNLKAFFDNIVSSLTSLGNNIKGFFSDLSTNLGKWFKNVLDDFKTWFQNLSSWLSALGDRIGNFFTSLWNNIKEGFENFRNAIKERFESVLELVGNWWQSVKDWWASLWTVEDGFFDEYKQRWDNWLSSHFGFLYQAKEYSTEVIFLISLIAESGSSNPVLTLPAIAYPSDMNNTELAGKVIFEQQTINLQQLFEAHEKFKVLFRMFQVAIVVAMVYGMILLVKKKFDKIIAGREI